MYMCSSVFVLFWHWKGNDMWIVCPEALQTTVTQILTNCSECGQSNIIRTIVEWGFLCYHMYKCASNCYDYNGHVCKHIHHVHSLLRKCNSTSTKACGIASNEQPPPSEYSIDDFHTLSYAESVNVSQTGTCTFNRNTIMSIILKL